MKQENVGYHKDINIDPELKESIFFIFELINNPENKKVVTQPIHRHPYYEILFVTQGEVIIEIDFKEYTLKKGSLSLFSPLKIHHPKKVSDDYKCYLIRFYPNIFDNEEFFKNIKIFDYDFISLKDHHYLRANMLLQELSTEFKENLIFKEVALGNLLKCFLITIQRALPETTNEKSYDNNFSKLNLLIVENDFKIAKPSEYADKLRISARSLNEIIKKHTGISAGEYIRTKTVFEAKRLLSFTSLTVKEIAYKLGFDDVAYFSRFFKKATNISALQYREDFLSLNKPNN